MITRTVLRPLLRQRVLPTAQLRHYANVKPIDKALDKSSTSAKPSNYVKIVEVGPRDGLQNEKTIVPTATKIQLIERLSETGLPVVEAGSFVSPKWVPQMADSSEILSYLNAHHQKSIIDYPFLVPNLKGLDAALALNVKEISIFAAASEAFSKKNINCSISESLDRFRPVVKTALEAGLNVRGYVSMVVGCPYEGAIPPSKVAEVSRAMLDMGCYEISLGDTTGVGNPNSVGGLLTVLKADGVGMDKLACHFHDTYGMAVLNCAVGLDHGVRVFDSSVAGLGGCPYAKGATGNVSSEDLVYWLHSVGETTGVNLEMLAETGAWISKEIGKVNGSKVGPALLAQR